MVQDSTAKIFQTSAFEVWSRRAIGTQGAYAHATIYKEVVILVSHYELWSEQWHLKHELGSPLPSFSRQGFSV